MNVVVKLMVCNGCNNRSFKKPGLKLIPLYELSDKTGVLGRSSQRYKKWNKQQLEELRKIVCSNCGSTGTFVEQDETTMKQIPSVGMDGLKEILEKQSSTTEKTFDFFIKCERLEPVNFKDISWLEKIRDHYLSKKNEEYVVDFSSQLYVWYIRTWSYLNENKILNLSEVAKGDWEKYGSNLQLEPVPIFPENEEPRLFVRPLFLQGRLLIQLWTQSNHEKLHEAMKILKSKKTTAKEINDKVDSIFSRPHENLIKKDDEEVLREANLNIIVNASFEVALEVSESFMNKNSRSHNLGKTKGDHYIPIKKFHGKRTQAEILATADQHDLIVKNYKKTLKALPPEEERKLRKAYTINDKTIYLYPVKFSLSRESKTIALTTSITVQQILNILRGKNQGVIKMDDTGQFIEQWFKNAYANYTADTYKPKNNQIALLKKIADGTQVSELPPDDQAEVESLAEKSPRFAAMLRKSQFACREKIRQDAWSHLMEVIEQESVKPSVTDTCITNITKIFKRGCSTFETFGTAVANFTQELIDNTGMELEPALRDIKQTDEFYWKPGVIYRETVKIPIPDMRYYHVFLRREDQDGLVLIDINRKLEVNNEEFDLEIPLEKDDEGLNTIMMAYSRDKIDLDEAWFDNYMTDPENMKKIVKEIEKRQPDGEKSGHIMDLKSVRIKIHEFCLKPDLKYWVTVKVPTPDMRYYHVFLRREDRDGLVLMDINREFEVSNEEFDLEIPFEKSDEGLNTIMMAFSRNEISLDETWFDNYVVTDPENLEKIVRAIEDRQPDGDQNGYIMDLKSVQVKI
ncbi:hypothetical protein [Desulfobacter latus]|uniref:Uncharacterized protein n=1 Tax=Desulfobacter latus TaxID=2292 RepID=A0A850SZ70_9BACT|nr:hypothetical protein [Desulfobacter latus]NWH06594.1 hypothetical protein [Desulfobacter latus]